MGNDNKINQTNDQRHKEVLLFLNDELNRLQTSNSSDSYDLEKEYAKTKKNKSLFSTLVLTISIVVVFLLAWGITAYINTKNEELTVNLAEFEGLNVKNLLDSVNKVQTNYDNAMKNKTNIISDRDLALRNAEDKRDSDLFLIESLTLGKKEEEKRKAEVLEEYEATVQQIKDEYEPQILLADNELAEYKKQLDEYDTSKLEAARQQEQALDSERRVHRLEMEKLSKEYEQRIAEIQEAHAKERKDNAEQIRRSVSEVSQKYLLQIDQLDPDLTKTSAQGIVNTVNSKNIEPFDSEKFIADNEIEDDTIIIGLSAFQRDYNQYSSVQEPFESIPYKKSAPAYIKAQKSLVDSMGASFGDVIIKFSNDKKELNAQIDSLGNKITSLNGQIDQLKKDNAAEKAQLKADFLKEKAQLAQDYTGIYDGILSSAKAQAVVISAHSKENIRIYVVEAQRGHITEAGVGAEIKAAKSVKGVIKPLEGEPGFYRFESALDKAGNPVDFDFEQIAAGQIVKVSAK